MVMPVTLRPMQSRHHLGMLPLPAAHWERFVNIRISSMAALAIAAVVASCGGSTPEDYDSLVRLANDREQRALQLAQDLACVSTTQCTVLAFGATRASCQPFHYAPLSTTASSATEALESARAQQAAALQALSASPYLAPTCAPAALVPPASRPACVQNTCTLVD